MKNLTSKVAVVVALFALLVPTKSYSQEKMDLDVSMMSKADAHKAKWTLKCARESDPKMGFLCAVEFARTVEKYTLNYKNVINLDDEKRTPEDIIKEQFLIIDLEEEISRQLVKKIIDSHLKKLYIAARNKALYIMDKCYTKFEQKSKKFQDCLKLNDPLQDWKQLYRKIKNKLEPLSIFRKKELREYRPREIKIL